ncbi:Hypothetical_protein [Hexamita inflata]|uniref:Hypothetical_protein n=1 Tax=Hexamita inflata TaxID=28002 RepID=A0AA86P1D7_9EUKA|nr:Hypothetical protein HINF_LOCUS16284 [Hexamita inflata]
MKHDDKKITQKTSNAEAQPENEKKKTKVSQKAEPTKNIEEKAPDKTKPKDAQKQKEEKHPVQKSQDQKTTKKHYTTIRNKKFLCLAIYLHYAYHSYVISFVMRQLDSRRIGLGCYFHSVILQYFTKCNLYCFLKQYNGKLQQLIIVYPLMSNNIIILNIIIPLYFQK